MIQPTKKGQIVKFHTPYEDEDPIQMYVTLEIYEADRGLTARIQALNTGLSFPSVSLVLAKDLMVDKMQTNSMVEFIQTSLKVT